MCSVMTDINVFMTGVSSLNYLLGGGEVVL